MSRSAKPEGELAIRTLAMPADTNPSGNIFGGWVVSQMDLAGLNVSRKYSAHNVVTVAIEAMQFIAPAHVGDFVCCYAKLLKLGRTSIHVKIQTWALEPHAEERRLITEGVFVYVAVDEDFKPITVTSHEKEIED